MDVVTILVAIVVFGVIIFVHELGHLLFAKKYGVYCYEFSLGMGPKLFSKKYGETNYSIRAIPIGGFVSMAGENDEGEEAPEGRRLNDVHKLKQAMIIFAGAFFNFILGFIIIVGINFYIGIGESVPVVGEVLENSVAEEYGIENGYKIIEVNGKEVIDFDTMVTDINDAKKSGDLNIVFEKNGNIITIDKQDISEDYTIGISYDRINVSRNIFMILKNSFAQFISMTVAMFGAFAQLIVKFSTMKDNVGGPVMIVGEIGRSVEVGFIYLMQMIALLSINLGVVNLLPIPGLDGSKILISIGEFFTKRDLPRKLYVGLSIGGVIFLLLLMVLITFKDIMNLI